MSASALLSEARWTGVVLVLSFVLFAIGGILPVKEHLMAVVANTGAWCWANIFMGTAAVVLLVGLSLLTTSLEAVNEHALSRLGLLGWLMATILWVIFSVFRIVVTMQAAHEMTMAGPTEIVPTYYEPLARWAFGLFYISAMIGFLAMAAYGGALLRVGRFPAWVGWATLGYSVALLIHLLITGDTLSVLTTRAGAPYLRYDPNKSTCLFFFSDRKNVIFSDTTGIIGVLRLFEPNSQANL